MWNWRRIGLTAAVLFTAACSAGTKSGEKPDELAQAVNGVPRPDHVLVVIMENTSYSTVVGSSSAPYINSLIAEGATFSDSHAVSHPSEPNYLALFSGSTQGVTSDACPLSFGTTANLGSEVIAAGLSFTAYSEDLPSAGSTVCTAGSSGYARKHAPWVNFSNVPTASQQPYTSYPSGNYATLPTVSFVVPNLCDDMHDCSLQTGDTWLQNNIDGYVQWAKTHNSLLVLTWDEDDSSTSANQILTVFVGQMVKTGTYGETINHYNVLHTIEDMYGLAAIANAASAPSITDVWQTGVASDFSLSVSPSTVSVAQGSSGTASVSTSITSGSAESVALSASGLPAGVTATFSPTSVTSGSSATLGFTVGSSAAAGTYAITITGTGSSASHTASLALTVTAATSGGGLTNGGFEAGSLAGWTATGTASVVSSGAHGGTYAARLGSTSPTNGDSTIAQTFTAPAGVNSLSFWYEVVCPDTVQYDWATATLKDNTSGTTATVLAKVCSNSGAWTQATASITAGHSYTLTLVSHDDNYPGDPTYTLYDDVALVTTAPPPPSPIVNGDFETGSLSGWTASGTAGVVSSGAHGGTYAARLGSTSPTNGDSAITQTFTAPAGSSKLSFWYEMTCPDTVQYDWATATLKDNTSGTTTAVLAKVCSTGAWKQVTAAVTAGHSYTLSLVSHDDNYPGDPTYTLYDDVTMQ